MKNTIKYLKLAGNILLWVFLIFAILITVMVLSTQNNKDGLPNLFGKSTVTILTDSMKPEFSEGDMILVSTLTAEEKAKCKVGDIITFYADLDGDGDNEINTHRIVEVEEGSNGYVFYTTRGDNNNGQDDTEKVSYALVLGKYDTGVRLAGMGKFINFMREPTGFLLIIVLPLVVFFFYELYRFIALVVTMRQRKLSGSEEEEIKRRAIEEYLRQQAAEQNKDNRSDGEK